MTIINDAIANAVGLRRHMMYSGTALKSVSAS